MIIKEKTIEVEKPFEPFTIELIFETKEDVEKWFSLCHYEGSTKEEVSEMSSVTFPVNKITQLLIEKGF